MANKNLVRQKLCSVNLYAKSYAITKFDYSYSNEIFTINIDSTLTPLWHMCGPAVCARELLKNYEALKQRHINELLILPKHTNDNFRDT